MTAVSSHADQVAKLRQRAAAGDPKGCASELLRFLVSTGGDWSFHGRAVTHALTSMPQGARRDVALELLRHEVDDPDLRAKVGELAGLVKRQLPYLSIEADEVCLALAGRHMSYHRADQLALSVETVTGAGRPLPPEAVAVIRRMVASGYYGAQALTDVARRLAEPPLNMGEVWAEAVLAELPGLGDGWAELITHAGTATSAKPSASWTKRARELLVRIGPDAARGTLVRWLSLVGRPRTFRLIRQGYEPEVNDLFDPYNATFLRGLIWLVSLTPPSPEAARVLGGLVETSLKKVPGTGPRSPKIANAAVYALSAMDGEDGLAQLARLAARVTFKGTLKEINAALDKRAAALHLSRDEVEELAVPSYGLTEVGRRHDTFGAASAEIAVTAGTVTVTWRNERGKAVKSVPASVRANHADELKDLKATVKDIDKMLSAQAERLDRQFLARRTWRYGAWRNRYLDHPLVGTLARRLIWIVDDVACAFADGDLRRIDDTPVTATPDTEVRLWHPIGRPVDEVLDWRAWLERHSLTQPFKQAHREVYLLTAAEERTRVYSNRFAAHILRQHQFHALAAVRGWRDPLRLMVDDSFPPANRELPQWGLRAEFWVEGIGDEYGSDTTDAGTYLRLTTDQVRFYSLTAPENLAYAGGGGYEQWVAQDANPTDPIPLDQIPPLVLSEVLRDVDLFVGVASVGNDPTWSDGGPHGRFREYWASYSFGELNATAQTRRELLARLVPRLAIADRVVVDGRFLRVRGDLRTYKIHLGSGNILMEPNDQYLCIVPKQSATADTGGLFLPFEGDRVLAVILSKAMLLANDTAITDPTITQQIRR